MFVKGDPRIIAMQQEQVGIGQRSWDRNTQEDEIDRIH